MDSAYLTRDAATDQPIRVDIRPQGRTKRPTCWRAFVAGEVEQGPLRGSKHYTRREVRQWCDDNGYEWRSRSGA